MYLTEKEIFSQYDALKKTYGYMMENADAIRDFWKAGGFTSIYYAGCGSGYCLCRSAAESARLRLGKPAFAMAAGDLMLNFPHYERSLKGSVLVAPSRSGSTSEVLKAAELARRAGVPCIAISAVKDSPLGKEAALNLEILWAFDESVCQTRTVSNLYAANLIMIGILADDSVLLDEIKSAIDDGPAYMEKYRDAFKKFAARDWDKAVVLADSELTGIADEGAVAFKEIPQIVSNYYHLLDVRHGPMVMIDGKTLVIVALSPFGREYQADLITDLKGKGAFVISVGSDEDMYGADAHITHQEYKNYGVAGIPFIFVVQAVSYYKALDRGVNPDAPQGLSPWIKL